MGLGQEYEGALLVKTTAGVRVTGWLVWKHASQRTQRWFETSVDQMIKMLVAFTASYMIGDNNKKRKRKGKTIVQ